MSFTTIPQEIGFARNGGGISFYPDDGSTYIQQGSAPWAPVQFSFTDGSLFSLISADLAGYSTVVPDFDIQFLGYHPDGSTVAAEFMGSGIDFQTYYFKGLGFTDLISVEIQTPLWSLDNLVGSVPEPPAGVFLFIGSLLLCGVRLGGKRSIKGMPDIVLQPTPTAP
jgi:hypothetical protein